MPDWENAFHGGTQSVAADSAQLGTELDTNPLLRNDKQLRLFCFIVKGDIDQELNSGAMRYDWEQVQALARELGNDEMAVSRPGSARLGGLL